MGMELVCLNTPTILLWCLISPALSRLHMILFTLNLQIVQFQLNLNFQQHYQQYRNFYYWKKSKHYLHRFCPKSFKKSYSYKLMDEDEINKLVQACKLLKYKFQGVFAADSFPVNLSHNSFIIVNVSTSQSIGTRWTLFCRRKGNYIFADPLRQNLASYKHLHNRMASLLIIFKLCMNC